VDTVSPLGLISGAVSGLELFQIEVILWKENPPDFGCTSLV
jgi:hypothetical protein